VGFLVLFLRTDYRGSDTIEGAVNLLFRLDPFLAACVVAGTRTLEPLFLPALGTLLLTLVLGRVFCGWFCPLGTLLDITRKGLGKRGKNPRTLTPRLPLLLFFFCLFAAIGGWGLAGFLDPFSLLVRGLAQALYPLANDLTVAFFTFTYNELPQGIQWFTEGVYAFLQAILLPSSQKVFFLPLLSLTMLLLPLVAEVYQPRFFCRNLCPLGGMLGLVARFGMMRGRGGDEACGKCRLCATCCRMGAVDGDRQLHRSGCTLCWECVDRCPRQIIQFGIESPLSSTRTGEGSGPDPGLLSRRQFLVSAAGGLLLPSASAIDAAAAIPHPLLIRPPGARAEGEFNLRCVRCAECIQVCIGNALQPALFQGGIAAMFSPLVAARTGYCEFNCTLCGQVCPSGAIMPLSLEKKQGFKIGHAFFDTDLCLPYAKGIPCMVCEEHCPTPEKAIRFKPVQMRLPDGSSKILKQPYVVDEYCIGCGICEFVCPLPGKSAIIVTSAGEERHPERSLPLGPGAPGAAGAGDGYGGA
jgi:polyferredoxin